MQGIIITGKITTDHALMDAIISIRHIIIASSLNDIMLE